MLLVSEKRLGVAPLHRFTLFSEQVGQTVNHFERIKTLRWRKKKNSKIGRSKEASGSSKSLDGSRRDRVNRSK